MTRSQRIGPLIFQGNCILGDRLRLIVQFRGYHDTTHLLLLLTDIPMSMCICASNVAVLQYGGRVFCASSVAGRTLWIGCSSIGSGSCINHVTRRCLARERRDSTQATPSNPHEQVCKRAANDHAGTLEKT